MNEETTLLKEETQPEEILNEEVTPAEEIPAEETPVEETSTEETPAEETPTEETSTEETPAEEAPTEETSTEEIPAEETPAEEASAEEAQPEDATQGAVAPYHERYYLRYREGKRSTALDLGGTAAILREMGFDGGELRQAREGKNRAEDYRNVHKKQNNQMRCSYCGSEIAGVEFYRLPGGRMRCTTCSSTIVKTKQEMEELCRRVITNMDSFFGATINVPVAIETVEQRRLKKKLGIPLGTKDSLSTLILGAAVNNKSKYSILLENGAPRISVIATFAHELTHIWQYTHWDNKKGMRQCPMSKRLLIYEGMAKWVEIQYLYLIGETNIAKREEFLTRNRNDEYGIGFRLYADRYPLSRQAMTCEDTPFTPGRYPFDEI